MSAKMGGLTPPQAPPFRLHLSDVPFVLQSLTKTFRHHIHNMGDIQLLKSILHVMWLDLDLHQLSSLPTLWVPLNSIHWKTSTPPPRQQWSAFTICQHLNSWQNSWASFGDRRTPVWVSALNVVGVWPLDWSRRNLSWFQVSVVYTLSCRQWQDNGQWWC